MFDITSMKANYIFCEKNWSVFRRDSKIAWFFYLISLILLKFFILISLLAKNREKSCFFHQIIVIVIKEITGLAVRACLHFSAFLTLYFSFWNQNKFTQNDISLVKISSTAIDIHYVFIPFMISVRRKFRQSSLWKIV